VRLTGCDLRCTYCDSEYAFNGGERLTIEEIPSRVATFRTSLVEVTGGEPLLQPEVHTLMRSLADKGMKVLLETSGAHDIGGCDPRVIRIMDLKTPSSGESGRNRWENLPLLRATDEVKFVIADRADFDWSAEIVRKHRLEKCCPVLFSPVWKKLPLETLAEWIKESGLHVRLQPQLHKILYGDRRSV
jgi:7-carboxy-7-deazaguanine synthase